MDYEEQVGYCLIFESAWQNELRSMTLLRLLMWLLVIWLSWFMIRNYLAKQTQKPKRTKPALPQKMVKCDQCSVHLPQSEALQHDARWFCSRAHLQAHLEDKQQTRN